MIELIRDMNILYSVPLKFVLDSSIEFILHVNTNKLIFLIYTHFFGEYKFTCDDFFEKHFSKQIYLKFVILKRRLMIIMAILTLDISAS